MHGIYQLMPTGAEVTASTDGMNLDYVDGFNLRFAWSELEPTEGNRKFEKITRSIAVAKTKGKKISIGVAALVAFPAWLEAAGAKINSVTVGGEAEPGRMPWPNDPVFLAKWENFTRAMAAEFDNDPVVTYVRMGGLGQVLESYVVKEPADVAKFKAEVGTTKLVEAWKQIVAFHADAWKNTAVLATLGAPIPGQEGTDALWALADWMGPTYPKHAGFAMSSWSAQTTESFVPAAIIKKYSHSNPTICQQVHSAASGQFKGTLEQGFTQLESLGPPWGVEIYKGDFSEANRQTFIDAKSMLRKEYN